MILKLMIPDLFGIVEQVCGVSKIVPETVAALTEP